MAYYVQWRWCMRHERLCAVYDWQEYGRVIGEVIRSQWAERQEIRHWLDLVRATHRDAYTVDYLERVLRLGTWTRRDLATARTVADIEVSDVAAVEAAA